MAVLAPSLFRSLYPPIEPFNFRSGVQPVEGAHLTITNSNNSEKGIVVDADDYVADDDTEANDNDNKIENKRKKKQ